jgi:hypothetical protein
VILILELTVRLFAVTLLSYVGFSVFARCWRGK